MDNQKYRNIKFVVSSEEDSKAIQEFLFTKGCYWYGQKDNARHTDKDYLFVDGEGHLTYSNDYNHFKYHRDDCETVVFQVKMVVSYDVSMNVVKETILLNGKTYYKEDLEKALQHIKEVV